MFKLSIRVLSLVALLLFVPQVNATIHTVNVGNFFFSPLKTTVQPGDTVRWNFTSATQHTSTSDAGAPKAWDSGLKGAGGSFDVVFELADGPGPFPYHCTPHSAIMKDTIFMSAPPSCCVDRGNVDDVIGPGGPVDVSDLTYLVNFLFKGGPVPPCEDQGNVDSIVGPGGPIDVSDLTYLVNFLFKGGPAPPAC